VLRRGPIGLYGSYLLSYQVNGLARVTNGTIPMIGIRRVSRVSRRLVSRLPASLVRNQPLRIGLGWTFLREAPQSLRQYVWRHSIVPCLIAKLVDLGL
jgi:hypothetical protein